MLDFIAKYWLQVVFGLIVTGMGIAIKKIWKLYKTAQTKQQSEERADLLREVDKKIEVQNERMIEADNAMTCEISHIKDSVNKITQGVLSVQGQSFREACRRLLEPSHIISIDEYEQIIKDHEVYNSLGGNHIGDRIFSQVEKKFEKQAQEQKKEDQY